MDSLFAHETNHLPPRIYHLQILIFTRDISIYRVHPSHFLKYLAYVTDINRFLDNFVWILNGIDSI